MTACDWLGAGSLRISPLLSFDDAAFARDLVKDLICSREFGDPKTPTAHLQWRNVRMHRRRHAVSLATLFFVPVTDSDRTRLSRKFLPFAASGFRSLFEA